MPYRPGVCGNGIKEPGEECDAGGKDSACCDPKTCKLIGSAVCEDSNESCCNQCKFRPSTHQCRPSASVCDTPEYCTGDTGSCPADKYAEDGLECGSNELRCASGQCTSRDTQCLLRGYPLNVTQSCSFNHEECKIACASNTTGKCVVFNGHFLNGTPCDDVGKCYEGNCVGGSNSSKFVIWFMEHKDVAIPVTISIVILSCIVCITFFWFRLWSYCCCFKRSKIATSGSEEISPNIISTQPIIPIPSIKNENNTPNLSFPTSNSTAEKGEIMSDLSIGSSSTQNNTYK